MIGNIGIEVGRRKRNKKKEKKKTQNRFNLKYSYERPLILGYAMRLAIS